ncbi:MAG TPA: NAD(P)/FAD-dependent oxidoreductase [Pyrinomonadaceae bacterium]|jgi:flavin-dependent dehydrogenase
MSSRVYDVLIVGAGPAGACVAIEAALGGARVLLAEQKRFPRAKLCGEFISPECLSHFARLGVMGRMLEAGGREVVETRFYTRGGRCVGVPSEWFERAGVEGLGGASARGALGLSRAEMDAALLARAREVGVEVLEEAQAVGLWLEKGRVCGARLRVSDERELVREREAREVRARVTIDATGRTRALARLLEREARQGDESRSSIRRAPLVAFKAHLEGARGEEGSCEIYFYGGGYGGLSPVEGGLSNLCFIASASDVRARGSDAERVLREVVRTNRRAEETLRDARISSEWLSVALEGFGRRGLVPAAGLVAVGDAASFIDPFTGSGMLMALESGTLAAEALARWLARLRSADESRDAEDFGRAFEGFAEEYRARYDARFGARLRLCSWLRRAAFAPPAVSEAAMMLLGASDGVRRRLARATRGRSGEGLPFGVGR